MEEKLTLETTWINVRKKRRKQSEFLLEFKKYLSYVLGTEIQDMWDNKVIN